MATWSSSARPRCRLGAARASSLWHTSGIDPPNAANVGAACDGSDLTCGLTFRIDTPTVNRMVQYQSLDRTFSALSDPTRRAILERLGRGPATISELAQPYGMTLTGLKKHIRILEAAELVTTEKVGRTRQCRLGPGQLDEAARWIQTYRRYWQGRLDRLERYIDKRKGPRT
jgi:DNA-binding transcriptional ArsR family regulator